MASADDLEVLAGTLRDELVARAGEDAQQGDVQRQIRALVDERAGILDAESREELARRVAQRAFGLGPLESLLADPDVDEVMVCGTRPVWVERHGRLEPTQVASADEAELLHAVERILAPLGRRVDEAEPLCDARLPECLRRLASCARSTVTTGCEPPPRGYANAASCRHRSAARGCAA